MSGRESIFESERRLVRLVALRDLLSEEIATLEKAISARRAVMPPVLLAKAMPGTSERVMRRWLQANGYDVASTGRLTSEQRRAYSAGQAGAA